jgi:hypothetical protein
VGVAAVIIFLTSIPIAYYSSKYKIDMDLLTRGAGFGYLGSTLTSVIIPFVIFGMTLLAKLQVWTMPLWLILLFGPFIAVGVTHPAAFAAFSHFGGNSVSGSAFTLVGRPSPR